MNKLHLLENRWFRWYGAALIGLGIGSLLGLISNLIQASWYISGAAGAIVGVGLLLTVSREQNQRERILTLVLNILLASTLTGLGPYVMKMMFDWTMSSSTEFQMFYAYIIPLMVWYTRALWIAGTIFFLAVGYDEYMSSVKKPTEESPR